MTRNEILRIDDEIPNGSMIIVMNIHVSSSSCTTLIDDIIVDYNILICIIYLFIFKMCSDSQTVVSSVDSTPSALFGIFRPAFRALRYGSLSITRTAQLID